MKDFDEARGEREERDRGFKINGQTFVYRPAVAPETLIPWFEMGAGTPEREAIALMDEVVLGFLEEEYRDAWREARKADATHPINRDDMFKVIEWLLEEQVARPTQPPSDSPSGGGSTETSSTEGSSLRVAEASAA